MARALATIGAALIATSLGLSSLGCSGGARTRPQSAAAVVSQYVAAVEKNDPKRAYSLLAADVRRDLPYREFEEMWRSSARERKMQAAALAEVRKASPDLGTRALVAYKDGRTVALSRESTRWHLERALVGRVVASSPRDAVRALSRAIDNADFSAFVAVLSRRKREPLLKMLSALSKGLDAGEGRYIQRLGDSRAQMFWEDDAGRYRLDLILEADGWRLDDFEVILKEEDDEPSDPPGRDDDDCDPDDPLCGL